MRLVLAVAVLMVVTAPARAEDDPDTEVARRHFEKGRAFYAADDYVHALEEFEAARKIRPVPALDFNIGRAHDRMGHWEQAIVAYQRYVEAVPAPADAPEVRARISVLQARKPAPPAAPPLVTPAPREDKPSRRTLALAIGIPVGAAVLTAVIVGLAVGLRSEESFNIGSVQARQ
jgi:tetratricopeptide (TPR) repeat protein